MKAQRIIHFMQRDFFLNKSVVIISAITLAAVLFLFNLISSSNIESVNEFPSVYYLILYVGGLWLASLSFRDFHDRKQIYTLLTLPCSTLEKFFGRWFLTSFGFAIGLLAVYAVLYWCIAAFSAVIFRQPIILFNPLNPEIWKNILQFIILQSMFLLGAVYFKKHSLIKTILTMTLTSISVSLLIMMMTFFAFHPVFSPTQIIIPDFSRLNFSSLTDVLYFLFWIFIPILCWSVAYQRLKECEDK